MTQIEQQDSLVDTPEELEGALEATIAWLNAEHGYQGEILPKGRRNHALHHPIARALRSLNPSHVFYYVYPTTYNRQCGPSYQLPDVVVRCAAWIDAGYYPELLEEEPPPPPPDLYEAYVEAYRRRNEADNAALDAHSHLRTVKATLITAFPDLRSWLCTLSEGQREDYLFGWCQAQVRQQATEE